MTQLIWTNKTSVKKNNEMATMAKIHRGFAGKLEVSSFN